MVHFPEQQFSNILALGSIPFKRVICQNPAQWVTAANNCFRLVLGQGDIEDRIRTTRRWVRAYKHGNVVVVVVLLLVVSKDVASILYIQSDPFRLSPAKKLSQS